MKINKLYKYINLLLRIIIGVVAVYFIYLKLRDEVAIFFNNRFFTTVHFGYVVVAIFLVLINWGIESKKWQFLIQKTIKIQWFAAFKKVMTGITVGFITPNRIGEIPARAILLNDKKNLKNLIIQTSVGAYSQLVVTLLFGTVASLLTRELFELKGAIYINLILVLVTVIMILSYFFQKHLIKVFYKIGYFERKKLLDGLTRYGKIELTYVFLLSILRYLVFSFQFFLVLRAFNFYFFSWTELLLIPVCFMIASLIPTILISEMGVRGSVALLVFGTISDMDVQIVLASILLWVINVVLPAFLGIFNFQEFKLIRES